ncbi:hypothetical protein K502DRAFT_349058 [Neoconidiobolus thromboides FSU 785]|nr:hypothetical protein K502DRAFT_349058 [Neoconidiobolus thromboides FSU 785]
MVMFETNANSQHNGKNSPHKENSPIIPPPLSIYNDHSELESNIIQSIEQLNISPSEPQTSNNGNSQTLDKSKKGKQRWGSQQKNGFPPSPGLSQNQDYKKHPIYQKIEEINIKLRSGVIILPNERRSPSPEPLFNAEGKQVNTREIRYRKRLEEERQRLIEQAVSEDPNFKPPIELKKPAKLQEKYYIPVHLHPEINFIGLLIGPRGNTLKRMELDSGAKISIRGRGSVKEGKRFDANGVPGNDEELHCLITADTSHKIKKAKKLIERIIETSASVPEGQNELKRQQLRELAALNGTLRDDETHACGCCGMKGHKKHECQENPTGHNIICYSCIDSGLNMGDCNHATTFDNQMNQEMLHLMEDSDPLSPTNHPKFRKNSLSISLQYPHPSLESNIPSWKLSGPNPVPSPGIPYNTPVNGYKSDSTRSFLPDQMSPGLPYLSNQTPISEVFPTIFNPPTEDSTWDNIEKSISAFNETPMNHSLGLKFYPNQLGSPRLPSPKLFSNSPNPSFKSSENFKLSLNSESTSLPPPSKDPVLPWVSLSGPNAGEESQLPH